jgi:hypothetical protein
MREPLTLTQRQRRWRWLRDGLPAHYGIPEICPSSAGPDPALRFLLNLFQSVVELQRSVGDGAQHLGGVTSDLAILPQSAHTKVGSFCRHYSFILFSSPYFSIGI